jgi:hypothetical protein
MQDDIAEIFSFYQKAGVEVIGIYAISDKGLRFQRTGGPTFRRKEGFRFKNFTP